MTIITVFIQCPCIAASVDQLLPAFDVADVAAAAAAELEQCARLVSDTVVYRPVHLRVKFYCDMSCLLACACVCLFVKICWA